MRVTDMSSSLLNGIRGTVQGVIGATDHVLWWVSWHTGAPAGVRALKR
jgi:hypothetical protein